MGEENLIGREVNLIVRLEKLAGSLGERCGISDAARGKLDRALPIHPVGEHELKGFEGKFSFLEREGGLVAKTKTDSSESRPYLSESHLRQNVFFTLT